MYNPIVQRDRKKLLCPLVCRQYMVEHVKDETFFAIEPEEVCTRTDLYDR
jgi:hypothetical protein